MESEFVVSPLHIWQSMGIVGQIVFLWLVAMSIHSLTVIVDRFLRFREARRQSDGFVAAVRDPLARFDLPGIRKATEGYPRSHVAPLYSVAAGELADVPSPPPDGFDELLERAVEREAVRVSQDLKKGLGILASISGTAPFVGLFGTVVGIMNAFFGMAASGEGGITVVAGGVAEALVNTAMGIFVALPAHWGFNTLLGRVERLNVEMKNTVGELVDHAVRRQREGRWPSTPTTARD